MGGDPGIKLKLSMADIRKGETVLLVRREQETFYGISFLQGTRAGCAQLELAAAVPRWRLAGGHANQKGWVDRQALKFLGVGGGKTHQCGTSDPLHENDSHPLTFRLQPAYVGAATVAN